MMRRGPRAIRLPRVRNSAHLTLPKKGKNVNKMPEQDHRTLRLLGVVILFIKYLGGKKST